MNLADFEASFSTEEACRNFLFKLRWPKGFRCSRCGCREAWPLRRTRVECCNCNYQMSVIVGTIFQDTRKPLTLWFRVIWWMVSQETTTTAFELQRVHGLSYKTAWTWLHKLRRAMVKAEQGRLSGQVTVIKTILHGHKRNIHGSRKLKKVLIAVAAEKSGEDIGRIRMQRIRDTSARNLDMFVRRVIEPGSVIYIDDSEWRPGSSKKEHTFKFITSHGQKVTASQFTAHIRQAISLMENCLIETHQRQVSHKHIDYYLAEFIFRFNNRNSSHPGELFCRLIQNALNVKPAPYLQITKGAQSRRGKNTSRKSKPDSSI